MTMQKCLVLEPAHSPSNRCPITLAYNKVVAVKDNSLLLCLTRQHDENQQIATGS